MKHQVPNGRRRFYRTTLYAALVALGGFLTRAAPAQETNAANAAAELPLTKLEAVETNTGRILIRGSALIGVVPARTGSLEVACREVTDTVDGSRLGGVVVAFGTGWAAPLVVVDYDELAPLISAMDRLAMMDWSASALPGFDAFFTTRGGLRVAAYSSSRSNAIEYSVRGGRDASLRAGLSREQFAQLREALAQAKRKLDQLGAGR